MKRLRMYIQKEIATFRRLNSEERRHYIWDYYKLPILAVVIVAALVIMSLMTSAGRADTALYVMLINAEDRDSTLFTDLLHETGENMLAFDADVTDVYTLDRENGSETDVATMQVLAAQFAIGDMDLFAADEPVFEMYAEQNGFENMGLLLPQDLQAQLSGDLYRYVNEDGMEVVGGLWLREGSLLHEAGYYHGDVLIGIASGAQNLEEAVAVMTLLARSCAGNK